MDKFLGHSAAKLLNSRSQSIFLINNYDYLTNFLEVRPNQAVGRMTHVECQDEIGPWKRSAYGIHPQLRHEA